MHLDKAFYFEFIRLGKQQIVSDSLQLHNLTLSWCSINRHRKKAVHECIRKNKYLILTYKFSAVAATNNHTYQNVETQSQYFHTVRSNLNSIVIKSTHTLQSQSVRVN